MSAQGGPGIVMSSADAGMNGESPIGDLPSQPRLSLRGSCLASVTSPWPSEAASNSPSLAGFPPDAATAPCHHPFLENRTQGLTPAKPSPQPPGESQPPRRSPAGEAQPPPRRSPAFCRAIFSRNVTENFWDVTRQHAAAFQVFSKRLAGSQPLVGPFRPSPPLGLRSSARQKSKQIGSSDAKHEVLRCASVVRQITGNWSRATRFAMDDSKPDRPPDR